MRGMLVKLVKQGRKIYLWVRTSAKTKTWVLVEDFRPYFYYPSKLGEYKSIFGETLDIVYAEDPSQIPELRSKYPKHYEADIPYVRRFLIDTKVHKCVEVPEKKTISYREVKPCECDLEPYVWLLDIEVYNILEDGSRTLPDSRNPVLPIISISIYDYVDRKYVTWAWHEKLRNRVLRLKYSPREGESYDWEVRSFNNEYLMLADFIEYYSNRLPDIISGWNISFDKDYLSARLRRLEIPYNFQSTEFFDMLEGYKSLGIKRRSYALKNVTVEEGIETRAEAREARDVIHAWRDNPIEVIKYNVRDVWRVYKINESYNIIKFYDTVREIAGVESITKATSSMVVVDTLVLREAKEMGYVLPSVENRYGGKYKGALVLQPKPGLIENVAVLDMSRYYPSLIISFNISPETKLKKVNEIWVFKQDVEGILPRVVRKLLEYREELEAKLKEYQPGTKEYSRIEDLIMAVKSITNSCYGVFGAPEFRLYDRSVAETITGLAREGIMFVVNKAREMGYEVIYGDTDSIFIQVPFDKAEELAVKLSEELRKYFKNKYNLKREPVIKLKFEKYYRRILFSDVKKRYVGWLVWKKGKEADTIDLVGFEGVRSDYPIFTSYAEHVVAEKIVKEGIVSEAKIVSILQDLYKEFKNRPLEDIALSKGLSKSLDEYVNKSTFVRAALYSNMYLGTNFKKGDKVMYVYVKRVRGLPPTDVVAFEDSSQLDGKVEVDYERQFRAVVIDPLNNMLRGLGIRIKNISYSKRFW